MRYDLIMIELSMKQFVNFKLNNIIEIGSRDGHDTECIRNIFDLSNEQCYIFEAHPDCYESIKKTYPDFNVFNCAVTNKTGIVKFNAGIFGVEDNIGISSILKDITGKFKSKQISIDGYRFDEICDKINLSDIDLVKIDVEGHAKEVLHGFGKMIDRTKAIQIELEHVECWEGQALYEDIKNFLLTKDFIEVFFIRHAYDQSDSFWINKKYYKNNIC